jgi:hypothetical protein
MFETRTCHTSAVAASLISWSGSQVAFEKREVDKTYLALIAGRPQKKEWESKEGCEFRGFLVYRNAYLYCL